MPQINASNHATPDATRMPKIGVSYGVYAQFASILFSFAERRVLLRLTGGEGGTRG